MKLLFQVAPLMTFFKNFVFGGSSLLFILSCNSRWEQTSQLETHTVVDQLVEFADIQEVEKKKLMKITN